MLESIFRKIGVRIMTLVADAPPTTLTNMIPGILKMLNGPRSNEREHLQQPIDDAYIWIQQHDPGNQTSRRDVAHPVEKLQGMSPRQVGTTQQP